jgi:hypothetical protein
MKRWVVVLLILSVVLLVFSGLWGFWLGTRSGTQDGSGGPFVAEEIYRFGLIPYLTVRTLYPLPRIIGEEMLRREFTWHPGGLIRTLVASLAVAAFAGLFIRHALKRPRVRAGAYQPVS